jgi:hypothetical protein
LNEISGDIYTNLSFRENFHSKWNIYEANGFRWWKVPFLDPVASDRHFILTDGSNSWNLDQGELQSLVNQKKEVDLVIYFTPQAYYMYALVISGICIFILSCYLVVRLSGKFKQR